MVSSTSNRYAGYMSHTHKFTASTAFSFSTQAQVGSQMYASPTMTANIEKQEKAIPRWHKR